MDERDGSKKMKRLITYNEFASGARRNAEIKLSITCFCLQSISGVLSETLKYMHDVHEFLR